MRVDKDVFFRFLRAGYGCVIEVETYHNGDFTTNYYCAGTKKFLGYSVSQLKNTREEFHIWKTYANPA